MRLKPLAAGHARRKTDSPGRRNEILNNPHPPSQIVFGRVPPPVEAGGAVNPETNHQSQQSRAREGE